MCGELQQANVLSGRFQWEANLTDSMLSQHFMGRFTSVTTLFPALHYRPGNDTIVLMYSSWLHPLPHMRTYTSSAEKKNSKIWVEQVEEKQQYSLSIKYRIPGLSCLCSKNWAMTNTPSTLLMTIHISDSVTPLTVIQYVLSEFPIVNTSFIGGDCLFSNLRLVRYKY